MRMPAAARAALAAALVAGCAGAGAGANAGPRDNYLRHVAFRLLNESVLLRWQDHEMPLQVYLPRPPQGMFDDPEAIFEVVRDGVTDWADLAAPGVPSFEFVDDPGAADIPFRWEERPTGKWFVAHCVYDISPRQRRFGVATVLVTARHYDGSDVSLELLYLTVLHEMGHALGLGGHSPEPSDVMYGALAQQRGGLSERDRNTLRALYDRPNGSRVVGARRERAY
ncbi:MAG: matrixin family metalloprotease [Deltaproteobacteria bacterium]|nr:MAG: matrixin family metalloprotease [Deltaproteobacteria bacterium]